MGLVASMLQDFVSDIKVDVKMSQSTALTMIPSTPPILFGGQHLLVYALVPSKSTVEEVKLTGKIGDKLISFEIKGDKVKQVHDAKYSIHRIAAKAQLVDWAIKDLSKRIFSSR